MKSDGYLIIRDWANPNDVEKLFNIKPVSNQAKEDMDIWINELLKNSIIDSYEELEDGSILTNYKNAYEILFHTVWGLKSLSRESKEQYNIENSINDWVYHPWAKLITHLKLYQEKDETYLSHLQKYFDLDSVPFNTKSIYIFQKNK